MPTSVAFLGLGTMGSRMAANLARSGVRLSVYNQTATGGVDARVFAAETGATAAETPADSVADADVIVTMVSDGPAVTDLYARESGILAGLRSGALCIDMSTIGPSEVLAVAAMAAGRGADFADAPVSGSVALAEAGELTVMVGGSAEAYERARPVLESMSSTLYHVGPLGSGAAIKMAIGTIIYALNGALSEALVVAERAGIGRETAYEIFANSAIAAPFVHYRRQEFERPGTVPVAFRLVLAKKDLNLALDLGESLGMEMAQTAATLDVVESAIAAGYGDHDVSAVSEFLRHGQLPEGSKEGR
jgi:3-hydroxyisobutyrate dehydrogenase-like beta-hydroxyacid dehydrogenase